MLACPAHADFTFSDESDFTGEAFFRAPEPVSAQNKTTEKQKKTIAPVKLLRLKVQNKAYERAQKKYAPTEPQNVNNGETTTSEYASKEIEDDFDEISSPDGFEADEEMTEETKKHKLFSGKKNKKQAAAEENKQTDDIILDCENVDYDTENYLIHATGNASMEFVPQEITVKADDITFDRLNNTIKAEGNVKVLKNGKTVTGDYIFVDMNEENALIQNPVMVDGAIVIRSENGYVNGDKIVQEYGTLTVDDSYPINFRSATRGPRLESFLTKKKDTLTNDIENDIVSMYAKDIKVKQKGELEVISIKKGRISKGNKTVFRIPAIKIYTNKNHDYVENNYWEIGAYRGLGVYTGPGWVFELPKGSVFKAIPMLNYKSGAGFGAVGRFQSGTNYTQLAYGSAADRFFVYGKQELDDDLFLQYSMNSYMDEWFLGRRRPKYGTSLVYQKSYSSEDFLLRDHRSTFAHRLEAGYFQNLDFDGNFEKIRGANIGTTRFRYMMEGRQNLFKYEDEENLKAVSFDLIAQLSAAVYGTGDTQSVARFAPQLRLQYKRWGQDLGYYFSAYKDDSPMQMFDSFRYGKQNLYIREYLKLCRWLTVSWFGAINTTNDAIDGRTFQENSFYFTFGPDDFKMHLGYDFARETIRCIVEVMMDAKGTNVNYDKFEIKQEKKPKKETPVVQAKPNPMLAPTQPKVLQKAVVENVKVTEDVL